MRERRFGAGAVLLRTGEALVVGGARQESLRDPWRAAERYDPRTGAWHTAGAMRASHEGLTATALLDGRVLVVGAADDPCASDAFTVSGPHPAALCGPSDTELYDRRRDRWTAGRRLRVDRGNHVAVRLPDGRVLVAGGSCDSDACPNSIVPTEIYDPRSAAWSLAPPLAVRRDSTIAALLPGGQVLVAGGIGDNGTVGSIRILSSAEVFHP